MQRWLLFCSVQTSEVDQVVGVVFDDVVVQEAVFDQVGLWDQLGPASNLRKTLFLRLLSEK